MPARLHVMDKPQASTEIAARALRLAVLYLDFDGVLHPAPVYRHPKRGMYFMNDAVGHTLFENSLVLVEALAPYPDVRIVLSTSWVSVLGFARARAFLPPALQARVVGATFHSAMHRLEFDRLERGEQVLADATRRRVTHWVALDDDELGWHSAAATHLVLTDTLHGIGAPETQDVMRRMFRTQFSGSM
jgi:hypothetical protein